MWWKKSKNNTAHVRQAEQDFHTEIIDFFIAETAQFFEKSMEEDIDYSNPHLQSIPIEEICLDGYGFAEWQLASSQLYQEIALFYNCAIVSKNFGSTGDHLVGNEIGIGKVKFFFDILNQFRKVKFYSDNSSIFALGGSIEDTFFCYGCWNAMKRRITDYQCRIAAASVAQRVP